MAWEKATQKYPIVKVDEEGDGSEMAKVPTDSNAKTVVEANSRGTFSRPAQPIL